MGKTRRSTLPKVKHSRICITQSRYGCDTCKYVLYQLDIPHAKLTCGVYRRRRVKCDEGKPSCSRCTRSGLLCGGYAMAEAASRQRQLSSVGLFQTRGPHQELPQRQTGAELYFQINDFAETGLDFLTQNLRCSLGASAEGSDRLLRQVALSSPCILNSLAALGALAMCGSSGARRDLDRTTWAETAYVTALNIMGRDISYASQPKESLALGCVLLATVELLLGHARNAFLHYRAAFQVYGISAKQPNCKGQFDCKLESACYTLSGIDDFDALLQSLDLSVSGYAVGMGPRWCLSHVSIPVCDLISSRKALFAVAQECDVWFSSNFRLKFFPALQTQQVLQQQCSLVTALRRWLQQYNAQIAPHLAITEPQSNNEKLFDLQHGLQLRMLCNWLIIQTTHAFNSKPSGLDVEEERLQQIILDGEQVMYTRLWRANIDPPHGSQSRLTSSMTLGTGIIWPLYSAARAYGSPTWRRRAVRCLAQSGLEGPWNGRREAALLWRIVEHEEAWPNQPTAPTKFDVNNSCIQQPTSTNTSMLSPLNSKVQDTQPMNDMARIHDCIVPINTRQTAESCTAVFYRCSDMDAMIRSVQGLDPQSDVFDSQHHWQVWQEPVVF